MVTKYSVESGETQHHLLMAETFDQVDIVEINQKDVLVCRTSNHRLYIDDKNISNNVTSFCLHSEFLLLTTLQHTLLCFSLNEQGLNQLMTSDLTVKPWENEGDTTEHCKLQKLIPNSKSFEFLSKKITLILIFFSSEFEKSRERFNFSNSSSKRRSNNFANASRKFGMRSTANFIVTNNSSTTFSTELRRRF